MMTKQLLCSWYQYYYIDANMMKYYDPKGNGYHGNLTTHRNTQVKLALHVAITLPFAGSKK